ncbi:MAG TPA: hypothetical protein DCE73_02440 [Paraprevotella xylaniphila]|nr:hypothetical protein [Paraprevotella xylaniphila]
MKRYILFAAIACGMAFPACDRPHDTLLEEALEMAGENRTELEKVLAHYVGDSLKLEAAKYLIRHMPGHYSQTDTAAFTPYYDAVDSLLTAMKDTTDKWVVRDSLVALSRRFGQLRPRKVQDVKIVTAGFLIQNIDSAFVQWKEGPWARHLDFEDFCEYLLPYKAEELQPLDGWRTHLRSFHPDHLDELAYCDLYRNSALQAAIKLNDNLWYYMKPGITDETILLPVHRWRTRLRLPIGTCADYGTIATSVFRSQGIPVVMDFTPQWAFRSLGHSWNVLLAEDGRHIPFSGACSNPGQPHKLGERMPKVFRRTYAMNPELRRMLQTEEYVPDVFRNPFIRDVTEEYMDCRDAAIHVPEGKDGHYAFLTVFDNKEWVPVDFARMEDGKATFHKVGMNTVYLPVCYEEGEKMKPLAAPFLFAYGGKVRPVVADTARRADLVLWRKYPVLPHVQEVIMRIDSGEFQASNEARFKEKTVLHRVTDCSATGKEILLSDTVRPYRYWRFYQPKEGSYCNIADIRFYERGSHKQIKGKIIGTDGHWEGNPEGTRDKVFDDDLLTFFDAPLPAGAWAGMDFGRPVALERIIYTARGDGNTIDIGDTYELFYWNGQGWSSLGKQEAANICLRFRNVPSGGLYWLRDLSKGKEERIFTYEQGRQVWW